jgi:3-hydroxybutyryl-CoA dehydrogenase
LQIEDIQTVLIVGSGNMGQQIGFQCAASGFSVILYDISADMLEKAMGRMGKLAPTYISSGRLTENGAREALLRIKTERDPEKAGCSADIISESVPEDPALKARTFAAFNDICPARTIFTTNTSSLLPSMFAQATGRPDRFAALHFHDTRFTNIVDIMPHAGTSKETISLIEAFAKKIGQVAIVLQKESNGYVFNAMLMTLLESAQTLAARQVASVEDIDRSWMGVMHTMVGPFAIMDSIGIDTVYKITDYWAKKTGNPQQEANALFLKQYVDRGDLGVKTGRGFYTYPAPAFQKPGFIEGAKHEDAGA